MITLSLSEAKMKLSGLIDKVRSTDEEIVITRNGAPAAILISPDEFEGFKDTLAVRSDTELTEEIKKGIKSLKARKARLYTLDELFE